MNQLCTSAAKITWNILPKSDTRSLLCHRLAEIMLSNNNSQTTRTIIYGLKTMTTKNNDYMENINQEYVKINNL